METIEQKIDRMAELQAQAEVIRLDMQAKLDAVLTAEQRQQMEVIKAEYGALIEAAQAAVNDLNAEITTGVLARGETVKGARMQALFVKGRTTWDTKALEGVAATIPEIARFRKVGEPSVSFRVVK